ncbi:NUDIX domain-containing protein [Microbacterium sp. SYP-A9085]|uniref:NUDIX hydrolase n=1 Tax=Microbacterium sp. SYP-A9085 TaxID=2664454 RepID=UPI00129BD56E|nr:NUDIX hydrolase [Microbacterium sp. SYP-A9085]MRH28844.1 NUDIX domain-containing protein [Microbacterium sp. SYP-A9085]
MTEIDRALRELRTVPPAGEADAPLPVAGTAVLVRDGRDGPEVLLMRRPENGSFGGAWVFPGGRVEPGDLVAGAPEVDDARRAAARETSEEVGLSVDAAAMQTLSCWTPPTGIRKRIRTWFFAASVLDAALTVSPDEVVDVAWERPGDVLERHARGELTLYPPTWITLHDVAGHRDAAALVDAVRVTGVRMFSTVVRTADAGPVFVWEPDAAHDPDAPLDAPGPRHRLLTDALPWRYLADGTAL